MDSCEGISGKISPPIRVVLLVQDLEFGGTQRYAVHLLKKLDRRCFSPELWVLRGGMDMVPMARESGAPLVWMSHSSWVTPQALGNLAWKLIKERPHILYTLTVVPNIWGRIMGRMARVPVIVSSWRSLYPKQYESWMWPLSTRIICNAHVLKDVMIRRYGVDPERIAVIHNPVDADFFSPEHGQKAQEPTVLSIGRLVKEKDPRTLLEGFRLTAERMPEARFEIVGDGYLKDEVEALIRAYSLQSRVRLRPGQADIRPDLRRAWVFAMASFREASPNVVLEAMATQLPVVAPRVGGIPELVRDGETGLIFEPGNPEAMADALTRLLQDESLRNSMGSKGRQRVQAGHTMELMIAETQRVFIEAVNEKA
ncbi:MAG: glycosyltransferase family 4 protein [Deltaproteobacteria bacterium]